MAKEIKNGADARIALCEGVLRKKEEKNEVSIL